MGAPVTRDGVFEYVVTSLDCDAVKVGVAQVRASALLDDLAPGARVTDRLFYGVPGGTTITSVVLRESPSSPGIRVALSRTR